MKNIKFDNIESFIDRTAQHDDGQANFEGTEWIEPIALVLVDVMRRQYEIDFNFIDCLQSARMYAEAIMNPQNYNSQKTFVPIRQVEKDGDIGKTSTDIASLISKKAVLSDDEKDDLKKYLEYMLYEMLDNVISHSKSPIGGFATAQYFPTTKTIQVAIADGGIGFMESLRANYNPADEFTAMEKALEPKVTGSQIMPYGYEKHKGMGLFFMQRIMGYAHGKFMIISNDKMLRRDTEKNKTEYIQLDMSIKGSLVSFMFNMENLNHECAEMLNIIRLEAYEDKGDKEELF